MLSLAGLPPTAGFMAKVLVFQAAVNAGHAGLVVVAMLASVVGLFFYLRVIVLMYMQDPEEDLAIRVVPLPGFAVAVTAIVTTALGVFPSPLLTRPRARRCCGGDADVTRLLRPELEAPDPVLEVRLRAGLDEVEVQLEESASSDLEVVDRPHRGTCWPPAGSGSAP